MTYQEFISKLNSHLKSLSAPDQLKLAYSVCKKLFFDYQIFSVENEWGDTNLLIDAINFIQQSSTGEINRNQTRQLLNRIVAITPDTVDFDDASYALNACVAICETLEYLLDKEIDHIYNTCICLTDTVDAKIQEQDDLTENEIDVHSEMINARNFLLTVAT